MAVTQPTFRDRARAGAEPVARLFGRLGLTPNALTLIGFGIAVLAAVSAASQVWLAAGLLVAFGAAFDMLDGALARATNRISSLGAFIDSVFDRAGELVVYVGIALGCLAADFAAGALLAMTALASAMMVSYTRARAEGLGFGSGQGFASVGLAPREVRVVILVIGLLATGLAGGVQQFLLYLQGYNLPFGIFIDTAIDKPWLQLSLGLITILATITTIQRIVFVYLQAKKEQ
jgi:CDP-diacylglycerol---glycerol-3-phosphate 3-phosphatidyltransferase